MSERTYYQRLHFSENEMLLVAEILNFQNERKDKLEKSEKSNDNKLKLQKSEILLKALKYYYNM